MFFLKRILSLLFLMCFIAIKAFAQSPESAQAYFKKPSVVGLMVLSHIGYDEKIRFKSSSGTIGSHDLGITHIKNGRYDDALKSIDPEINPQQRLKDLYMSIYMDKNKTVIPLDITLDARELENFVKPDDLKKRCYQKDLRFLKARYNIDELLIVNMYYSVYVYKTYVTGNAERSRSARSTIRATLVDLEDNSVIINTYSHARLKLSKKWNSPPDYDLLKSTIKKTIDISIINQWQQYDWESVKKK